MKKTTLGLLSVAVLLGAISFIPSISSAQQNNFADRGTNCSPERHEAMEKAFESGDYGAWKELMQGGGRATQVVTQENFAKFAQAHELAEQGKFEEAKQIREELGLGVNGGHMRGMMNWSR